jgi:TolB-like protein/tetratricopeptide (TPR) repeat protein
VPFASQHLQVGDFVLDCERRCLFRGDGSQVPLRPRLYRALELLSSRPGELFEKRELIAALWPSQVVEENNLSQLVSGLRRALGDDLPPHRYIQTEPRRGLRFVAPVTVIELDRATGAVPRVAAARDKLAVLPFLNLHGLERDSLLALGMADSLIARLSVSPTLSVCSVGSVRRFAGRAQDCVLAGRQLGVQWVVDGTLQRQAERLRVTARLLCVDSGVAVWTGQFEDRSASVFELQDTICRRVADALRQHFGRAGPVWAGGDAKEPGGTRHPDAYQLYLAAMNHSQGIRSDGLVHSVALYEQALRFDPGFALAHVGIAEASRRSIFGADRSPVEVFDVMRHHTERALHLAPDLAEAHTQLGWLRYWCDRDWLAAEAAFRHAIELNPSASLARFGLGFMLLVIGRCDEGIDLVRSARELDPMSLLIGTMESSFLLQLGEGIAGRERLERMLAIEPRFWIVHMMQAQCLAEDGLWDAAFASAQQAVDLAVQSTQALALKGAILGWAGRLDDARAVLMQLQVLRSTRFVPPTSLAAVHAALGEADQALDHLEHACSVLDVRTVYLKDDARWRALRSHRRFQALLAGMRLNGLPRGVYGP